MKRLRVWGIAIVIFALASAGIIWLATRETQTPTPNLPVTVIESDHIKGNSLAPITLVEFSDFQCPACAAYYPIVKKLIAENGDRVRLVYKHFPLPQHANAKAAAYAAEAAGLQGKFWEMHDVLFEHQSEWATAKDSGSLFLQYAKSLRLNEEKFQADSKSDAIQEHVQKNLESALAAKVNATPSFFLNGTFIESPRSYDEFRKVIDTAREP